MIVHRVFSIIRYFKATKRKANERHQRVSLGTLTFGIDTVLTVCATFAAIWRDDLDLASIRLFGFGDYPTFYALA